VDALESEINEQVAQVRDALRQARAAQDDYLADLHQAELEGLARTAGEHGVRIHPEPDVAGRVIDLTAVELFSADRTADRPTADLTTEPEQARSA
jgi:hypothetical protein